jgi:segregation and condensation protein B
VRDPGQAELGAIEAVLVAATEPVPAGLLAELLEVPTDRVEELCGFLADSYEAEGRGFVIARVGGGYRLQSHPAMFAYVERYVNGDGVGRLSGAALETLAVVAYKQPVSRAQVSAIRGVNAEASMRTLAQHGFIEEMGRDEGPGQAVLFGTTQLFLESVGIGELNELPALQGFVPSAETVERLEQALRPAE